MMPRTMGLAALISMQGHGGGARGPDIGQLYGPR